MKKTTLYLVLACLLTACGFHLRGRVDVPVWMDRVAIMSSSGNTNFDTLLKVRLQNYKITVTPELTQAKYVLIISHMDLSQQIVSIGASTNPRQYQLILAVGFSLQTPKGRIIQPDTQVTVSRQFTSNNDRILGSNYEANTIITEMWADAINQIINRLSTIKAYHAH